MILIENTRSWLQKSHILVPNEWLEACMEWIQEENQNRNLTQDEVNSMVYEQWLLGDLHELETVCLPPEVLTATKYQLNGAFALQIDSIVDVGQSFYSQTQKVKGSENPNVHVTAEEVNLKPWEQKPTRMLKLTMTDGTQTVQGIEYKPIKCLNPSTSPGAKVLVHGAILCRHGVLMLGEDNLTSLGGEVDTLVETNTILNMLQAAMDASAEHGGKSHQERFQGSELRHASKPVPGNVSRPGQSWSQRDVKPYSRDTKVGSLGHVRIKQENQSQAQVRGNQTRAQNFENNQSDAAALEAMMEDDPFLDDLDMDDFDVPNTGSMHPNQPLSSANRLGINQNITTARNVHERNQPKNKELSMKVKTEVKLSQGYQSAGAQSGVSNNQVNPLRNNNVNTDSFADEFEAMDDFDEEMVDFPPVHKTGNTGKNLILAENKGKSLSSGLKNDKSVGWPPTSEANSSCAKAQTQFNTQSHQEEIHSYGNNQQTTTLQGTSAMQKFPKPSTTDAMVTKIRKDMGSSYTSLKHGSERLTFESCLKSKVESTLTATTCTQKMKADEHRKGDDTQEEYPFTYLAKVMALPPPQQPTYHTVKAYISTLTSKLSKDDQKWKLSCKINDGTMAVDVDLSNQVLTEMIGFSAAEAEQMKLRIKQQPGLKEILKEGIQQCQQRLVELMCLMELELSPLNPRPVIVATKNVTSHHVELLYNRVMANWDKFCGGAS